MNREEAQLEFESLRNDDPDFAEMYGSGDFLKWADDNAIELFDVDDDEEDLLEDEY